MVSKESKDNDPTVEEEALDYDGTRTDQLDDSYRMRVVSASENAEVLVRPDNPPGAPPTTGTNASQAASSRDEPPTVDKRFGYDPYNAVVEPEPKDLDGTERKTKPQ